MTYLIVSIVCSAAIAVLLRIAHKRKIDIHQTVAVNHTAVIMLTVLVLKPNSGNPRALLPTWWLFAALGVLLPSVFIIMSKSVDAAGIVRSGVAQQLSLFLPIVISSVPFGKKPAEGRLVGITLAFVALFCLLQKSGSGKKSGGLMSNAVLLLGAWSGYGVINILFKRVAKSGTVFSGNLLVAFSLVTALMFGYLFYRSTKQTKEGVIGGAVLGCPGFANIPTYIRAHQVMNEDPTLVFTSMNIGVIVLGTLVDATALKEKVNSVNAADISMAVCPIACLFCWPQLRLLAGL